MPPPTCRTPNAHVEGGMAAKQHSLLPPWCSTHCSLVPSLQSGGVSSITRKGSSQCVQQDTAPELRSIALVKCENRLRDSGGQAT